MSSKVLLAVILLLITTYAQHRLEPSDGSIMHCAGQTNQDFTDGYGFTTYSQYLSKSTRPEVYMVYTRLDNTNFTSWFQELEKILSLYGPNEWVAVQLGLDFNYLCADIAKGKYDQYIADMVSGIAYTQRPFYIRLGYEFNGQWNNYPSTDYILSYQRITNMLRNNSWTEKYVATVWDYAADAANTSYMAWYPGDEYVDWWAVNVFSDANAPTAPGVLSYAKDAKSRGYPVLIGESTPRFVGVNQSKTSWDEWFEPYFDELIFDADNGIKGFCYINWDWTTADNGQWSDWGNAEIQDDQYVGTHYQQTIDHCGSNCFNADTKENVLKRLGLN